MVSEAASTANRRSQADEAPRGSQAARGMNRPPRGRGRRHINRNVRGNASNLGNPTHSGAATGDTNRARKNYTRQTRSTPYP